MPNFQRCVFGKKCHGIPPEMYFWKKWLPIEHVSAQNWRKMSSLNFSPVANKDHTGSFVVALVPEMENEVLSNHQTYLT